MPFPVQRLGQFLVFAIGGTQVSFPSKSDVQGLMAEIFASGSRMETCATEVCRLKSKRNVAFFF